MNVVIAGGRGLLGSAVATSLRASGSQVQIISRKPRSASDLDWATIKRSGLPENTNVVINFCGRSIGEVNPLFCLSSSYDSYIDEVFSSRIESTKCLVDAMKSHPVRHFINASAVGFYRPDLHAEFTEEEPFKDCGIITRLVKEWEEAAQVPSQRDMKQYQLRLGVVLAKNSNFVKSLYPSHRVGLGGPIGAGDQWISWIHVNDVVGIVNFLLQQETKLANGPINSCAPNAVRQAVMSKAFSESLSAPKLPFGPYPTPKFAMRCLLGADRATLVLDGQRVIPKKLLDAGFKFQYPLLEDALQDILGRRPSTVNYN